MYGAALHPRPTGYGARIAPARERTARLRAAYGPTLAGPAGAGYGPELEPAEPDAPERELPAYGPELTLSRGVYGTALARALPGRRPQRPPYGVMLRGPAGGTYAPEIAPHIPALEPEEPPEEEPPEEPDLPIPLPTVISGATTRYAALTARHADTAVAYGYTHTDGDPRDLAGGPGIDYIPRVRHQRRTRWMSGRPPRANSPRRDPEHAAAWLDPPPRDHRHREALGDAEPRDHAPRAPYTDAPPRDHAPRAPYDPTPTPRDPGTRAPIEDAPPRDRAAGGSYIDAPPRDHIARDSYGRGRPRDGAGDPRWHNPPPRDERHVDTIAPGRPADYAPRERYGAHVPRDTAYQGRRGRIPHQRVWIPPVRDYPDAANLRTNARGDRLDGARALIPPGEYPAAGERTVATFAEVSAEAEDGTAIELERIRITTDRDSWCWQLEARTSRPVPAIAPRGDEYRELAVTLNGYRWRFLIEEIEHERERTQEATREFRRLRGRTPTCRLDEPHSAAQSRTEGRRRTIEQIAADEAGRDYDLAWELPSWTVPAGTWSYDDRTPIKALGKIAAAFGAHLYSDPEGERLAVRRRYPRSPTRWTTTEDVHRLPVSLVTQASGRWIEAPRYAYAWAEGTTGDGVIVRGYRAEWDDLDRAGEQVSAPLKSSPLITSREAGRERVTAVIDASGPKLIDTLTMPLDERTGRLEPGQLVRLYDDRIELTGVVDAVTVTADEHGRIHQEIELETRPEGYRIDRPRPEWTPPRGDQITLTIHSDDYFVHEAGHWWVRVASGPRDQYIALSTPDAEPIPPQEFDA